VSTDSVSGVMTPLAPWRLRGVYSASDSIVSERWWASVEPYDRLVAGTAIGPRLRSRRPASSAVKPLVTATAGLLTSDTRCIAGHYVESLTSDDEVRCVWKGSPVRVRCCSLELLPTPIKEIADRPRARPQRD
jgi:hypothetical protein